MRYLLLILLAGCGYTRPVAEKQHARAVANFPEIGASFCADKYPIHSTTDSTAYLASLRVIDSLAEVLHNDSLITVFERESLQAEIERIRREMPHPENCDSLSEGLYRLVAKERQRGDRLERLSKQIVTVPSPPVIITQENTARVRECEIIRDKAILQAGDLSNDRDKWRGRAKSRLWMIIGLGAITILGFFLAFKRKSAIK